MKKVVTGGLEIVQMAVGQVKGGHAVAPWIMKQQVENRLGGGCLDKEELSK